MVKFEDALEVEPLDDGKNWRVVEDFYYDTDIRLTPAKVLFITRRQGVTYGPKGWRVCVHKDFETDFASIPRPLWALIGAPAEGKYRKAAVVHDFLYKMPGLATQHEADGVLLEAMTFSGVNRLERMLIYWAVRLFGHFFYQGGL